MIDQIVGNLSNRTLKTALRCTALRHEVIADNLANVQTPGYRRKSLVFEETLAEALGRNGTSRQRTVSMPEILGRVDRVKPRVLEDETSVPRSDGNSVDIDQESVALARNTGQRMAMLEVLNREFRQIRMVIRGDRR